MALAIVQSESAANNVVKFPLRRRKGFRRAWKNAVTLGDNIVPLIPPSYRVGMIQIEHAYEMVTDPASSDLRVEFFSSLAESWINELAKLGDNRTAAHHFLDIARNRVGDAV